MTTLLNGVLGGLLVGLVAAVAARFAADEPSGTTAVLRDVLGEKATSRRWVLAAGTLYGGLAGGALVALELSVLRLLAVPPAAAEALAVAVGWSALLAGALLAVRRVASARPLDRSSLVELFVYHLVYGVGFGLWIRVTWIT